MTNSIHGSNQTSLTSTNETEEKKAGSIWGTEKTKEPLVLLGTKVVMLQAKFATAAKTKATEYLKKIEDANAESKEYSDIISRLNTLKLSAKDNKSATIADDIIKFLREKGVKTPDIHTSDEIKKNDELAPKSKTTTDICTILDQLGSFVNDKKFPAQKGSISLGEFNTKMATYFTSQELGTITYTYKKQKYTVIMPMTDPITVLDSNKNKITIPAANKDAGLVARKAVKDWINTKKNDWKKNGRPGYEKNFKNNTWNEAEIDVVLKNLEMKKEDVVSANQTNMVYVQDFMAQYNSYTQAATNSANNVQSYLSGILTR